MTFAAFAFGLNAAAIPTVHKTSTKLTKHFETEASKTVSTRILIRKFNVSAAHNSFNKNYAVPVQHIKPR